MPRGNDRHSFRATGAACLVCGVMAGNSLDIPVYRYRLQRTAKREGLWRSANVGAIGICDPCIAKHAMPPRDYSGRNTVRRHRHIRLIGGLDEWHTHPDYVAGHQHGSLGPDLGFELPPKR